MGESYPEIRKIYDELAARLGVPLEAYNGSCLPVVATAGRSRASPAACARVIREYSEISRSKRNLKRSRVHDVCAARSA